MKRYIVAVLALPLVLAAQPTAPATLTRSAADAEWDTLREYAKPAATPVAAGRSAAQQRVDRAASLVARADQLKSFRQRHPAHGEANEAKRVELLCLNWAAMDGEGAQDARRLALLNEVRRDRSLAEEKRFEAAAWSHQVGAFRQSHATDAARLAAQETITRQLIAEFPDLPNGYESLLAIARDSAPERSLALLREMEQMPLSARLQADLRLLRDRSALVGQTLSAIMTKAGAADVSAKLSGRPLIIYAWSATNATSLSTPKRLTKLAPSAAIVGINLDADAAEAKRIVEKQRLPGEQYIDGRGVGGPLAQALQLGRAPLVYLVDRNGVIRDINALVGTKDKLLALGL